MTRLVIFDLDKTLSKVNVSFAFGKYLYQSKALSSFSMIFLVACYCFHRVGLLPVSLLHTLAFERIFFKKRASDMEQKIEKFLEDNQKRLFRPWLMQCLEQCKQEEKLVWIQSSSPDCLVERIAKLLGVTTWYASRYQVADDGTYASVALVMDGQTKRKILDEFLQKNLISRNDVTAYSDSMLDLPLLEGVGTVVAVNPEKRLKKIALLRNWQIWEEK